jgi:hypothetical protein
MGLLKGLLRVFEEIAERAERELYDEDAVQAELMALYMKLETGAISEEEFEEREAELVERLEEIDEHRQQEGDCAT